MPHVIVKLYPGRSEQQKTRLAEVVRLWGQAFKIQLTELGKVKGALQLGICLSKVLSGEKGKEIGQYFGIKGPAVSDAIKRVKGRLNKESQLREKIELPKGKIVPEFRRFDPKALKMKKKYS